MQFMQQSNLQADLDHLRTFVAVAKHLSFAKAGRELEKDSSVVTRRIHALEQYLKIRLFERTTRQMMLTEAGRSYLVRVRAALEELELAESELQARRSHPHGLLRVSLPLTFGRLWISPLLPDFLKKYPEVELDVRYSDHYVDLIEEGFDVAIRLGILRDSSLVARKLGEWQRGLFAAPSYIKRHGMPQTPKELAQHKGLAFAGAECPSDWIMTRGRERVKVSIPTVMTTDDATTLAIAAEAGCGIVVATEWLVRDQVARGKLVPVLPDWLAGPPGGIYTVYSSARLLPSKTRVFIDWIAQHLAQD